jgi:hypothetical protein
MGNAGEISIDRENRAFYYLVILLVFLVFPTLVCLLHDAKEWVLD